jgi:DNA gyrase subunit B
MSPAARSKNASEGDDEKRRARADKARESEPAAEPAPAPKPAARVEAPAPAAAPPSADDYGADKIQILEGLEAVRRRPGMYIGDTVARGLHHLVYEIVDNSVDEALAGVCKNIHVRITADDGVVVTDDGRGIPTDIVPGTKLSGVTVAYTKLHAGGKFDHGAYKVSGGLHGVGASVVNALSERCEVEVYRSGRIHFQAFERGKATTELEVRGKTDKRGTKVFFKPDPKIFQVTKFDYATLSSRLRELAFLNKGLSIRLTDDRADPPKEEVFKYDGGIREFVAWLNEGKEVLHSEVIYVEREAEGVAIEVAFQYNSAFAAVEQSFANNIRTEEGGTHLSGFRTALTRRLSEYARREKFFGPDDKPTGDNFREGLTAVISVKVREPQFEGQTKTKLGNSEVDGLVASAFGDALATYLEENPRTAKQILEKAVLAYRAWEAARKAKDLVRRKGALASGNLPGKLADCQTHDLESSEIFIVEGESAGGTAKMGRDRATQAILPLRGKILNVEKARIDKMLGHEEIRTLITALGTGIGTEENGEGFDLEKLRYGKVIIMTDADVDGSHIRTLLLTFLFRHMPKLIEHGRVYVAQPPLFRVFHKKKEEYIFEEKSLKDRLQALGCEGARFEPAKGAPVQGAEFERLVDALAKLEDLVKAVERRGVSIAAYLAAEKDGRLPLALWRSAGASAEPDFVRSEEGLKRRIKELEATLSREAKVFEEGDDPKGREGADVVVAKIYEHAEIARVCKVVEKAGLDPKAWTAPSEGNGKPAKPLGKFVSEGDEPVSVTSLRSLLAEVRKAGQKGVDVQRYKGLGEMNPDQLASTTLDPERRTLLQVRLSDAAEADRLFGLLMGESVEPRREFIERHALDVTNLDV